MADDSFALDDGSTLAPDAAADATDDDEWLRRDAGEAVSTLFHPVGTARMEPGGDPHAVLDQHRRVRGLDNLRVVDDPVSPNICRANTNPTCTMIAERAADWLGA